MRGAVGSACVGAVMALALLGCGGGGDGGGDGGASGNGNNLPPATGPGDTENFFPVSTGDTWSYYVTTTGLAGTEPSSFLDTVTVTGNRTVLGAQATVFLETDATGTGLPIEGYYDKTAGGIAYLGTNDRTDVVTPWLVPYEMARFPLAAGTIAQFTKGGLSFGEDLDGDGIFEKVDVTVTTTIAGFEPLAIGLGTFPRTVKATETQSGNVTLSYSGTSVLFSSTVTRWSAPGVGLLRTTQDTTVQSMTVGTLMEARGYVVGGTQHGFGDVLPIAMTLAQTPTTTPTLASDGTNFLAAAETPAGLVAQVFDGRGTVLGTATVSGTVGPVYPVAGFDGTNYWVTYTPYSNGTSGSVTQVLAHRLSAAGALQEAGPLVLASITSSQASIGFTALAFGPGGGLLAYTAFNNTTAQHELWGVIVKPDGTTGAGEPFPIATDDSTHLFPAIAFDGSNFLVSWQQHTSSGATAASILATRISPSGASVDASPLLVAATANGQYQPSVAFDGTNYLVAWQDLRTNPNVAEIFGARVAPGATLALIDGPATSGGFAIATGGTAPRTAPRVAFDGSEYLVVWTSSGYAGNGAQGVQATRVTTAGAPAVPSTMAIAVTGAPLATTSAQYDPPVVARRGNTIFVMWRLGQTPAARLQASVFAPF